MSSTIAKNDISVWMVRQISIKPERMVCFPPCPVREGEEESGVLCLLFHVPSPLCHSHRNHHKDIVSDIYQALLAVLTI